jgi:hypothetical protein
MYIHVHTDQWIYKMEKKKKKKIYVPSSLLHFAHYPSATGAKTNYSLYFMVGYRKMTKCLDLSEKTSPAEEMVRKNLEGGKAMAGKAKEMMAVEVVAAAAEGAVDTSTAVVASAAVEAGVEAAEKRRTATAAAAAGETVS